ncbi:PAS domain-containing sensor histidine kinase [Methanohalobium evestigatum]|uniref:PAS domain-containing sensor histidine kinase n=1 Tax=Methanohalobium evestigatum TaxID=2322 RepID=UPI0006779848|nr:PAS domain S-box protein [Methanohalobium evestigatum]
MYGATQDITDYKLMESKLHEYYSELEKEKLLNKKYLDVAGVVILVIDAYLNITFVNKKGCEILGHDKDDILMRNIYEFIPEKYHNSFNNTVKKLHSGQLESEYLEIPILTKNGEERIISWNNTVLKDDNGHIIGVLSSGDDRTKYREIEKSFRQITENMQDMVTKTDKNGIIEYATPSHEHILGYKPEEIVGETVFNFVHPDDVEKIKKKFNEDLKNVDSSTAEFRCRHAKGYYIWVETIGILVQDDIKNESKIIFSTRNINKRKATEEQLKENEEKYRTIFETTGTATVIADGNNIFSLVNREFERLSGYSKEEIEGKKNWMEFVAEEDIERLHQNYKKLLHDPYSAPNKYEYRFLDRYGNQHHINMVVSIVPGESRVIGSLLDVTELKNAKKALEKYTEELKSLDKMKDEFIANLSHELRTPLTHIKGYSDLINNETLGELNEKQKKGMNVIVQSCDQLTHLIESLLYLNVLHTEKSSYQFHSFKIKRLIDNIVSNLNPKIQKKNQYVKTSVEDELLIYGDWDYLKQVFTHLVDNANKFTPCEGTITIYGFREDDNAHITIEDNGIGIKKELIPNIFGLFYQIDGSMTRNHGGTGIGMYICKEIIELHNGSIWVESEEDVGTIVNVMLPLTDTCIMEIDNDRTNYIN